MQLITISPAEYLEFTAEQAKLGHSTITLVNQSGKQLAFKIKTTKPNQFQVKPSVGLIGAGQSVTVDVQTTQPIKTEEDVTAKFQINATTYEGDQDLTVYWKGRDNSQIQQLQLKSRLKKNYNPADPIVEEPMTYSGDNSLYKSVSDATQPLQMKQNVPDQTIIEQYSQNQDQISNLQKELSDLKVAYQSLQQQQQNTREQRTIQQQPQAASFNLKQMLVMIVISLILGALIGR